MKPVLDKFNYPEMESITSEDGSRIYKTPMGDAPSVTTILSTLPNPELDAWRERVGQEEADRKSKEATTIGTHMHDMLECHVLGQEYPFSDPPTEYEKIAQKMFQAVKFFGLRSVTEIWGVEVALNCEHYYAGRTDLVGCYKGVPSIIDYKTSIFQKKHDYLDKYKLQLAAYKIAHEYMFPEQEIPQGVLLIGIRPNPEFNKSAQIQRVVIERDEMDQNVEKWLSILEQYYA